MTEGQIFVIGLRIVVPLLILWRPLPGGVIALLLDAVDVMIVEMFGLGGMGPHYHNIDKLLDTWYLTLELWVALKWTDRLPRITASVLFVYRLIGVMVFEVTGWRPTMFFFPNLFENWFLFVLICTRYFPRVRLDTWPRVLLWLLMLYIPKAGQEYLLHVAQAQPWGWIKGKLGI